MRRYPYRSYQEYLKVQLDSNRPRIPWTLDKTYVRAWDISNIVALYKGRKCLCMGCRHDREVDDFSESGFQAIGIDLLPTERQIQGDMNKLSAYFEPASFDLVYACHALEHTYDPASVLSMIRSIATEGAYFVIPIRDQFDIEEPVFCEIMRSKDVADLDEFKAYLGEFLLIGHWIREESSLPSGAGSSFAGNPCQQLVPQR